MFWVINTPGGISFLQHLCQASVRITRQSCHSKCFIPPKCRNGIYKNSFFSCTIDLWHGPVIQLPGGMLRVQHKAVQFVSGNYDLDWRTLEHWRKQQILKLMFWVINTLGGISFLQHLCQATLRITRQSCYFVHPCWVCSSQSQIDMGVSPWSVSGWRATVSC